MRPRGLIGPVYAMARPRRPEEEGVLVAAIAGKKGSARERGARAARLVIACIRQVQARNADDVVGLALRVGATIAPTPAQLLAFDAHYDAAALVRKERMRRFEARECRQLEPGGWAAETECILRLVQPTLAARYAKALGAKKRA